jgi:hypothetical protein|tara:strand:+ start:3205 stop:3756 length:552 start_codon:yes stop_codon:yes gene_type:complete
MNNALYSTQNELMLSTLKEFYKKEDHLNKMMKIITGESKISLRIVDWFTTNYAKKEFTVFELDNGRRFKVYSDYKLKLKAYSKKRFDPFCRWDRINLPYKEDSYIETTIGQLNFFKWTLENKVIDYIEAHYNEIEEDMNNRNSNSRKLDSADNAKTRKKREELSISASKSIKKEKVIVTVNFQ